MHWLLVFSSIFKASNVASSNLSQFPFSYATKQDPVGPPLNRPFPINSALASLWNTYATVFDAHLLSCFAGLKTSHQMYVCVSSHFSHARLYAALWTIALQAHVFTGCSRHEYWSRLPFPSPWDFPNPGIEAISLTCPALEGGFFTSGATWVAVLPRGRCKLLDENEYTAPGLLLSKGWWC